jgi:hypothetical protein
MLSIGGELAALLRVAQEAAVDPVFMALWAVSLLPLFENEASMFVRGACGRLGGARRGADGLW